MCAYAWNVWYGSGCVATEQIARDLSLDRLVNKSVDWGLKVQVLTALQLQVRGWWMGVSFGLDYPTLKPSVINV